MIYSKVVNDFFLIYQRPVVYRKKEKQNTGERIHKFDSFLE